MGHNDFRLEVRFSAPLFMKKIIFLFLFATPTFAQQFSLNEIAKWKKQASQITIIRDNWGIPHVYGKTDADAVFGLLYAQCEDDFVRVEMNYVNALGRLAEVEGESKLYNDLRTRLFQDSIFAIEIYKDVKGEIRILMEAFADGLNYFLHTHPQMKPKLIERYQPWMPLLFSEGSIGGDIEAIALTKLKNFYGDGRDPADIKDMNTNDGSEPEPKGSNGFAIAPSKSATGNALLLINPHTSFYFRPEVHVTSEQGLSAYGAVTWGQFFIYQGFNEHCGWMHTTSQADAVDEYLETIIKHNDSLYYKVGNTKKALLKKRITLKYKNGAGINERKFTVYYTHRGPVVAKAGDQWISFRMMQEPLRALTQSFQRTKAKGLVDFKRVMDLRTNTSNNTVYADAQGNIGYWHGNFIPKRNPTINYNLPVDGTNAEVDWNGLHESTETIQLFNPANGWLQNCNSTPVTAAGVNSFDKSKYPAYMCPDVENPRGINAVRVLQRENAFTLDKLIAAAYDPYLSAFEKLIPSLLEAYTEQSKLNESLKSKLAEPVLLLQGWDRGYGANSIPTTLAVYWGQELRSRIIRNDQSDMIDEIINTSADAKLNALSKVIDELQRDYGTWKVAWGEVNRFQRLTGKINETFDDNKPSLPVPFASASWGSLASYGSRKFPGTKKMYGYVGNSFVAVIEFGKRIKAKSLLAGGENNNPASPHFSDQALIYTQARFKDVLLYKEDVMKHVERKYQPGD